jgi:D-alanyl-D-alanine dipeptidase
MNPDFSKKECKELVLKFGGSSVREIERLDTHQNGGSFDLTVVDGRGDELYMGTDHDDLTKKAATDYFEKKARLDIFEKEAKKNRRILKQAMGKAGFVNFAPEWWHWSSDK